jgi:hypothetical protein
VVLTYSAQDIFADWKTERFVVADQTEYGYDNIIIVLCDINFWSDHIDELIVWCRENNAITAGMTVELRLPEQLTAFLLRWR